MCEGSTYTDENWGPYQLLHVRFGRPVLACDSVLVSQRLLVGQPGHIFCDGLCRLAWGTDLRWDGRDDPLTDKEMFDLYGRPKPRDVGQGDHDTWCTRRCERACCTSLNTLSWHEVKRRVEAWGQSLNGYEKE